MNRKDFGILRRKIDGKNIIYFDSAATSLKPRQVIDAEREYYENFCANVHRSIYKISEEATERYERAREEIARLINSKPEEIIFTKNCTEGINLVAYSIMKKFKKGKILTSLMEHHSNIVPWLYLKNYGFKVNVLEIDKEHGINEKVIDKITKCDLGAFSHCSNVLGVQTNAKELISALHENGALALLDSAQAVPHFKVDAKKLDIDFLAFTGHKMFGPTGVGVLYAKEAILQDFEPFLLGGDMIKSVKIEKILWNDLPRKFEAGTQNIAGIIGLGEAAKYIRRIGIDRIEQYTKRLVRYAIKKMNCIENLEIYGTKNWREKIGIISFNFNIHAHDLATILDGLGICIRSGHHCAQPLMDFLGIDACARASFQIYNTKEEIRVFKEALEEIKKEFEK